MNRRNAADLGVLILVRSLQVGLALAITFRRETDIPFFYALAAESDRARFPYLDFWVEYPPLFPWLTVGLYQLAAALGSADRELTFAVLLTAVNLAAEYANLALVYALGMRLHGRAQAFKIALVYALLFPPVRFALFGMIEPLAEMALLGSLLAGITHRPLASGLLAGLGILAKVYPGAALPGLVLLLRGADRRRWLLCCFGITLLVGGFFLVASPRGMQASVTATMSRPAWESPWALIEGCCAFGKLPEPSTRGLSVEPFEQGSNRLPWPLVSALFGVAYFAVLVRRRAEVDAHAAVALTLFTVAMLMLWSRGFSPQFVQWLLPLLLIGLPGRAGLLLAVAFCVLVFVEYVPMTAGSPWLEPLLLVMILGRWLATLLVAILAARLWLGSTRAIPSPATAPS